MKQSHRYQEESSTKTGKKGRKLKKNLSLEACKCVAPFVKLHWWDCPEVNKPCPIHGNVLFQNMKPEKVEPDQNVTISFHPSSRTEKLFEPVKALLAQCDPETKINFQYFSPHCLKEKESQRNQTIQTSFEDLRKCVSSSVFVEKKKSGNENTNKMKKLKECFHSPCNSIAQKYPSPTSVRRNFNNENSFEESAQPWQKFLNGDINYNKNSEWFSSNPFGYKKLEKMSGYKRTSDFITVTQQDDKVINHKIYEIDHRKGINENIMSGFGNTKQTQIAYSSLNVKYPNEPNNHKYNKSEENKKMQENLKKENRESFNNSLMSMSSVGSVYVTPFFLMPNGLQTSDDEGEEIILDGKRTIGVQVNADDFDERESKLITRYVQKCEFESDSASEQRMNEVSLQTDTKICKCRGFSKYVESSDDNSSEKYGGKLVQTNIRENVRINKEKKKETKFKSTEVQTTNRCQVKEVLITRYNKSTKETGSQIQSCECETQDSCTIELHKSSMVCPSSLGNKQTQYFYESEEDAEYQNNVYDNVGAKGSENAATEEKREGKNSPVSDLSELKRLIFEFFDKATCNCREKEIENETVKKDKKTMSTMTEYPNVTIVNENNLNKEKLINKEIQTIEPGAKHPEVKHTTQNHQFVLQDDDIQIKTCDEICPFCGRNIRRFSLNASTNTEDIFAFKEKTTIIETDVTEITKIKKAGGSKSASRKAITNSGSQSVNSTAYGRTDSQKKIKTSETQSSPAKSDVPVPVAPAPTSTRNDKQDWAKSNFEEEKRPVSQTFRECKCDEPSEIYSSVQDIKYSHRTKRSGRQDDDRCRDESRNKKEDQKQRNRQFYHVSVNPAWPKDLTNSWKPPDEEGESGKQKRNQKALVEKDIHQTDSYPLKLEESQQNFGSGKQNERTKKREHKKRDNFGFLRLPYSSASQISINKGPHLQSKVIKSEESVNTLNQQLDCTAMKIFGEDANDLFTVKSCHLNPIRIAYDEQSCDKLLTCSFCRSLMLIKVNNKNDGLTYVPGLNDAIQSQNTQSESDEIPERQSYEKFALLRENVDEQEELEKSSNSSDLSTRTNENLFKGGNSDLES